MHILFVISSKLLYSIHKDMLYQRVICLQVNINYKDRQTALINISIGVAYQLIKDEIAVRKKKKKQLRNKLKTYILT
jgi:hypothetical protein